jgi:hypothetical protein
MSDKATLDKLDSLHGALAQDMAERLTQGEEIVTKDGEGNVVVTKVKVSAATLGQIRQFLKDNNIEVDKTHGRKRMGNIVDNLPFPGADDAPPSTGATH